MTAARKVDAGLDARDGGFAACFAGGGGSGDCETALDTAEGAELGDGRCVGWAGGEKEKEEEKEEDGKELKLVHTSFEMGKGARWSCRGEYRVKLSEAVMVVGE